MAMQTERKEAISSSYMLRPFTALYCSLLLAWWSLGSRSELARSTSMPYDLAVTRSHFSSNLQLP